PRHLHSFPTRRSSDLSARVAAEKQPADCLQRADCRSADLWVLASRTLLVCLGGSNCNYLRPSAVLEYGQIGRYTLAQKDPFDIRMQIFCGIVLLAQMAQHQIANPRLHRLFNKPARLVVVQ